MNEIDWKARAENAEAEVRRLRAQVEQMRELVEAVAKFDGRNNTTHVKQWAEEVLAALSGENK